MGAMVSSARFDELEQLIADAVAAGARLLAGGKRHDHPDYPAGHYFQPTLLVDATPGMVIAQTELFAPVMLVMRYDAIDEGIALANSTRYALGASVYGRSKRECDYAIERINAGLISSNDFGVPVRSQSRALIGGMEREYSIATKVCPLAASALPALAASVAPKAYAACVRPRPSPEIDSMASSRRRSPRPWRTRLSIPRGAGASSTASCGSSSGSPGGTGRAA
jgi:hypothetical protein